MNEALAPTAFEASPDDTIVALATASGEGALAVVRVSGPRALEVADRVFAGGAPLSEAASHTLHHGWVRDAAGERVDEVVAAVFRAPRSYTREDVVEFSGHGGPLPARGVLEALANAGARAARPGEFTLRAFLNGRLDLAQAEAVADLIGAGSEASRRAALAHLGGELSRRLRALGERLADAAAEVEARVDFAEDVGGLEVPAHVVSAIAAARHDVESLLAGEVWARHLREGAHVPIVGRPNAGKSSLFNRLVGSERAIVADEPGTTRDRVSETIELDGVRVTLSDTAGLRETSDRVEAIGVERTQAVLEDANVVLWVLDGSAAADPHDDAIAVRLAGVRTIVALNKSDAGRRVSPEEARRRLPDATVVPTSATRGDGVAELRSALREALGARGFAEAGGSAVNARQAEGLRRASEALARAQAAAAEGAPGELVATDLREALGAIGEVRGVHVSVDLLDRIFARFCIGK